MNRSIFISMAATSPIVPAMRASEHATEPALAIAGIETRTGGRLGVFARDVRDGRTIAHRANERFPMCSTFKLLAVGAALQRVDRGEDRLDRSVPYGRIDLLDYAPVTTAHVADGAMSLGALCEAAIVRSDNTAANLILRELGGPSAVTSFVRGAPFYDNVTRLDRTEPTLNTAIPGDARDTTTPQHIVEAAVLLLSTTRVLAAATSQRLACWMRECTTGLDTLRAGMPATWIVGDKTGSGDHGTRNDVAFARRPHGGSIVVAAYLTGATAIDERHANAALAAVGRVVSQTFA